jgi:hypothetical protein
VEVLDGARDLDEEVAYAAEAVGDAGLVLAEPVAADVAGEEEEEGGEGKRLRF